jgi:hypothetical protein
LVTAVERARRGLDGLLAGLVAEVEHRGLARDQGRPRRRRCLRAGQLLRPKAAGALVRVGTGLAERYALTGAALAAGSCPSTTPR